MMPMLDVSNPSDPPMNDRANAIQSCSCPRNAGEVLASPKCSVEDLLEGNAPWLFVTSPEPIRCGHAGAFGNGHLCTCKTRLAVYQSYGI